MSTTPTGSPKPRPKPERSFTLNKFRGVLRRGSKSSADAPNGSSPEGSEGRPSSDSRPSTPPPNAISIPGSPPAATSPRKSSSFIRKSLDGVRPGRHGRSSSLSFVPTAESSTTTAAAAPATNGTAEAKEGFDPFSESHDDKANRGWRKTVKGALRRTASRLSVSSTQENGKPPSVNGVEAPAAAVATPHTSPPLEPAPVIDSPVLQDPAVIEPEVKAAPAPEPIFDSKPDIDTKPLETSEEAKSAKGKEKEDAKDKDVAPAVPLEASTSLEWEHVNTADAERSVPSTPPAPAASDVTPSVEITPSDEDTAEAKSGLVPLKVSPTHLMPLRSEITELSPIMESPLTATRDDADTGLVIPIHEVAKITRSSPDSLAVPTSAVEAKGFSQPISSIEESYIEVTHLSEAAEAAEAADVANATHSTSLSSPPPSSPPAVNGAIIVEVTPATLKPSTSTTSASDIAASPALNAIELGDGGEQISKTDGATSSTPLLASTPNANGQEPSSSSPDAPKNATALSFVANTAWFVGACVVVGIGMVVGQVRSYRQVQRRSTSTLASYFASVKRWLRL